MIQLSSALCTSIDAGRHILEIITNCKTDNEGLLAKSCFKGLLVRFYFVSRWFRCFKGPRLTLLLTSSHNSTFSWGIVVIWGLNRTIFSEECYSNILITSITSIVFWITVNYVLLWQFVEVTSLYSKGWFVASDCTECIAATTDTLTLNSPHNWNGSPINSCGIRGEGRNNLCWIICLFQANSLISDRSNFIARRGHTLFIIFPINNVVWSTYKTLTSQFFAGSAVGTTGCTSVIWL